MFELVVDYPGEGEECWEQGGGFIYDMTSKRQSCMLSLERSAYLPSEFREGPAGLMRPNSGVDDLVRSRSSRAGRPGVV